MKRENKKKPESGQRTEEKLEIHGSGIRRR